MKRRKEQDVKRVFNDCTVMAICRVTETSGTNETSTIGP